MINKLYVDKVLKVVKANNNVNVRLFGTHTDLFNNDKFLARIEENNSYYIIQVTHCNINENENKAIKIFVGCYANEINKYFYPLNICEMRGLHKLYK